MNRNSPIDGILVIEGSNLRGVNAEIVSTLRASRRYMNTISEEMWSKIAYALDTRTPHNERVTQATDILRQIQNQTSPSRWIARFQDLPEHEFRQDFYPGYRDHSIHTLLVWLLGLYLFDNVEALRAPLCEFLRQGISPDSDTSFVRWWTLASLWHDSGYPFESNDLSLDSEVREDRLKSLSDALSRHDYNDALISLRIPLRPELLRELHRAGRHGPTVIQSVQDLLRNGDPADIIDGMWRRLGLPVPPDECAQTFIDDLTTKSAAGRLPFHEHGTFGALLLLTAAARADSFLNELTGALLFPGFRDLRSALGDQAREVLECDYIEFLDSKKLVTLAAEAIAYHNLNFGSVDKCTLTSQLKTARPIAHLQTSPHIVFLSLVDTLQDWDRPHFFPYAGQHRPATPADAILIQGTRDSVKVSIEGCQDSRGKILRMFSGWLDGLDALFTDGACFTRPGDLLATSAAPTLSAVDDSARRVRNLVSSLESATAIARSHLQSSTSGALAKASGVLEPVLRRAEELLPRLVDESHRKILGDALQNGALQAVERQAVIMIQDGIDLSIGRVDCRIGGGGFGNIYRIRDFSRGRQRTLAYKVFHGFELDNTTKRFYFRRGFTAMESLRCEQGVVRVDQMTYLPFGMSMQFIEGCNLEESSKQLGDIHDRLKLLHRIAETLASSHNKGIIHRDVKPANVLLDSGNNNCPVLTDFDLAHISGQTTVARAAFASQLYGAPEQFNQRLVAWASKPCVDVYGFGALMYNVLTHRDPPLSGLFGEEQRSLARDTLAGALPAKVAERLLLLLTNTTEPDPRKRLHGVDEMQQLEHVVREVAQCRRDSESTETSRINWGDWTQEASYVVTGEPGLSGAQDFKSRSGGTSWRIEKRGESDIALICTLNRDPRFEGVNFEGFSRAVTRQIDRALEGVGKVGKAPRATRHGQLRYAGSEMRIEIQAFDWNRRSARELGDLICALARAVE